MNEKKEVCGPEVSPVIEDKNVASAGLQRKLKDMFGIEYKGQNIDVAGPLAAYLCLQVGSGSEEA